MMEGKKLAAKYQVIESLSLILKPYIVFLIPGVWIHLECLVINCK